MGDMNDGPGLDAFERVIGKSFVETVMGSVFAPERIFHNTLWWMTTESNKTRRDLFTVEFADPIVNNPLGFERRVWLDHILVSPGMLDPDNPVHLVDVEKSGKIGPRDADARAASDHFAVHCSIEIV